MSWVLIWVIFTGVDDTVVTSTATQVFASVTISVGVNSLVSTVN